MKLPQWGQNTLPYSALLDLALERITRTWEAVFGLWWRVTVGLPRIRPPWRDRGGSACWGPCWRCKDGRESGIPQGSRWR